MSYLANSLVTQCETSLVTLDASGNDGYPLNDQIRRIGLGLTSRSGGWIRGAISNWRRIRALRNAAQQLDAECVLSFCDTTNILTSLACAAHRPVVLSERSDPRHQRLSPRWERFRKTAYARATVCVAQTDEVRDYLKSLVAPVSSPTQRNPHWLTIPSAIAIPDMDLHRIVQVRRDSSLKQLIYVGRLSQEKRVDRVLEAWAKLKPHHAAWRLVIVGDGAERPTLEKQALQLNLEDSIQWRGWSDDVWIEFKASHAYCLTSDYEGFPQSMLEAMATGLPVVAFDCSPAIRETIQDYQNGCIVRNESQFVQVLESLLSDDARRESLGAHAWNRARDFEWSAIAIKWYEAIRLATTAS